MEVVTHHSGLEVANPHRPEEQQYADRASPDPSYYGTNNNNKYAPAPTTTSPGYFSLPTDAHAPSTIAPTEGWTAQPRKQRSWLMPAVVAAAIAALVAGAAVGGGLGATLGNCRSDLRNTQTELGALQAYGCSAPASATTGSAPPTACSAGSTTLPTTTDGLVIGYDVRPPSSISSLDNDCPALAGRDQVTPQNEKFSVHCGVDIHWGDKPGEAGGGDVVVADMTALVAYDFDTCITACSSHNTFVDRFETGSKCQAVTFRWDLATTYKQNNANCWLKNATASIDKARPCGSSCLSAVRIVS